jgi:co-chaperonin GroES (HSP10)
VDSCFQLKTASSKGTAELTLCRDLVQIESLPDDIRGWPVNVSMKQSMIIAPALFAEPSRLGKVVAIGDGKLKDGRVHTFEVKVGDIVLCERYPQTGAGLKWRGRELFFMREIDILAIVKEMPNG